MLFSDDYTTRDYEIACMFPRWTPDLVCNNCKYETDYERFYNISDFDSEETIQKKINQAEICPKCKSKLERFF